MRIASPPVKWPCFYGIDFASRAELIANGLTVEQVCTSIGADSLSYIDLDQLIDATSVPTTVMNFVEGTRFTPAKHTRQQSPHTHLLKPKAAGLALAIESLGDQFHAMIDVTIAYPQGRPTYWGFFSGQVPQVTVRVREVPIPTEYHQADYLNDPQHRDRFQAWLNGMWARKDAELGGLLAPPAQASATAAAQ
mgnify:CR=1 FL=1